MKLPPLPSAYAPLTMLLMAGVLAAGCATDPRTTSSVKKPVAQMTVAELGEASRDYGRLYERKPKDKNVGLAYASALRMTGRVEQSLAVMQQMVIHHPEDREVLSAYGKALAAAGNLEKALSVVRKAQRPDQPDWKLYSAEGAILDQIGQQDQARVMYRRALDIVPNEPSVLSNLGMSYVLGNDLRAAETYLRKAINQPGADSRVRQNLALVIGLQGRFGEAEKIARGELPADEAEENIAYLRQMLSQQNAWNQLEAEDRATQ